MHNCCGFVAEVCLALGSAPSERQHLLLVGREDPEWDLKDYQREFTIERLDFRNFCSYFYTVLGSSIRGGHVG